MVNTKRCNWGKYLKEFKSHLEPRTIQRYIQLAKNVDFKKYPHLAYLSQANLLRLIQLGDGKTPGKLIFDSCVDDEFDPEDARARKQFQSETTDLIKKLATERRKTKEGEKSSKEPGEEAAKVAQEIARIAEAAEGTGRT